MTDKKELSEEEQKKEDMRKLQLEMLNSDSLKNLVIASAGKNTSLYGEIGKQATMQNYIQALGNPDEHMSNVLAAPYLQSALNAGDNLYEESVGMSHGKLIETAVGMYQGAITKVKVSDVLDMLGIKGVHESNISKENQNVYMEDFAKSNKEMYGKLVGTYMHSIQTNGVANAIAQSGAQQVKNLESILKENPNKDK